MHYAVCFNISEASHARFERIRMQLNQGTSLCLSNALGGVLSDMLAEVIHQVFSELLYQQKLPLAEQLQARYSEAEQMIQHVLKKLRQYISWSVSLLRHARLTLLVNDLAGLFSEYQRQIYLRYPVATPLVEKVLKHVAQVRAGERGDVSAVFQLLIQIADLGVTRLIREPKNRLGFHLVLDKTLNAVINMSVHFGYKRLEKVGSQLDWDTANAYITHFLGFMRQET